MKCEVCQHQFCWSCLGEYYGYKHSLADNGAVCGQRKFIFYAIYAVLGIFLYIKVLLCLQQIMVYLTISGWLSDSKVESLSVIGVLLSG
jgi:hypothetical protein